MRTAGAAFFFGERDGRMDVELLKALGELGAVGWLGFLSWQIIRWKRMEQRARKNNKEANGNGLNRRMTDKIPGNPGESPYEAINEKLDATIERLERFGHRVDKAEDKISEQGLFIARIEGQLGIKGE